MWYSVELLENGSIFIQSTLDRLKNGAKGKVLLPNCLLAIALNIKQENNQLT